MTTLDFPWWLLALILLLVFALYLGAGATLGFVSPYVVLRPLARSDREQEHSRFRAFGFSTLGALASGGANYLMACLLACT